MQTLRSKQLLILLAAIVAAFFLALAIGYVRVYWDQWMASLGNGAGFSSPSEQEKLRILASLAATSTPTAEQKSKTLHSLSSPESTGPTEDEKLEILRSLQ